MTINKVSSIRFDDMSLYTLASAYLDCFTYYPTRKYHSELDKRKANKIFDYIVYRKDEILFLAAVSKLNLIQN